MRTINHIYKSSKDLSKWILDEQVSLEEKSVLVQIFDASLNRELISEITQTIHRYLPDAIVIGSSSCGIIDNGEVHDYITSVSISEFESTSLKTFISRESDSFQSGKDMADSLIESDTKCILLFADNLFYNADELLRGFNESGGNRVILAGASSGDDFLFKEPFVIHATDIFSKGLVAVALSSPDLLCTAESNLSWRGVGKKMIVTKSVSNCVYEINNEPVLSIYRRYLGESVVKSIPESMIEFPLIYIDKGVSVSRCVIGRSDDGGLLYSTDIKKGTTVQFGIGNENIDINNRADIYIKASVNPLESIFTYSSASRKVFLDGDIDEEYKALASIAPQTGFISYGEYNSIKGRNSFLNASTVFLGLSETDKIRADLKTDMFLPPVRRKTDSAIANLIEVTTRELNSELDDNSSLIGILEQYKYAMDKSTLVSKTDITGRISYVNERFCELSGYSANELLGRPHSIVRHPDMSSEIFKDMWEHIKSKNIWSGMIQNRRKDGSSYYVHATIFPILDKDGNIVEFMSLREDLTTMINYEKSLEKEQEHLYQILDNQDSIVTLCGEDGEVTFLNKKFFDYFNFSGMKDFLSQHKKITELFVDKDGKSLSWRSIRNDYKLGLLHKTNMIGRDGEILTFGIRTRELDFADKKMYLSTLTDITEIERSRLLAEEAKDAKSNFLANMSHEIRTPMNGIIGFTDLLYESDLDEKQKNFVDIIRNSSSMLLDVVNGILDFSKIEQGKLELDLVEMNLFIEMEQLYLNFSALADKKGIEYKLDVDSGINESLCIDGLHLKQILSNLINNAIKFTSNGESIVVSASLIEDSDNYQAIRFSVKDSGIGISKERQKQIFSAFEQADGSTTREFGGTGLGLSISSSLVQLMGGHIDLKSQAGEGSEFSFIVDFEKCHNEESKLSNILNESYVQVISKKPKCEEVSECLGKFGIDTFTIKDAKNYKKDSRVIILFDEDEAVALYNALNDDSYYIICVDENSKMTSPYENLKIINTNKHCSTEMYSALYNHTKLQNSIMDKHGFSNINILVAEDNEVNQILIKEVLNKLNVNNTIVNNGKEAVAASKKDRYDLIFMDVNMPVMNGMEATKAILEDSLNKETPVVAMTSNVLEDDIEEFERLGMYSYLGKPFHASDVFTLLSKLFDKNKEKIVEQKAANKVKRSARDIEGSLKKAGSLLELPDNIMDRLFNKFTLTMKSIITELQNSNSQKNHADLLAQAHKLKGSSSSLCFDRITEISKNIEELARKGEEIDYTPYIDELREELNALNVYSKDNLHAD